MPSLQEIERLKNILNELADEPEIRGEQGETIEDVLPPGQEPGGVPGSPPGKPRAAAAGGPVPRGELGPEESFDASALVGSDDELGELDSFEDFFAQGDAGGPGGAGAPPAEAPGAPGGPGAPEELAPREAEGWEGEASEGEASEGEAPEGEPAVVSEEDVLAALGLTEEAFAEEAPLAGPEEAQPVELEEPLPVEPEQGPPSELEGFGPGGEADEFGIPPGLLGPIEEAQAAGEPPEATEEFELPEEFTLPELGPQPGEAEEAPEAEPGGAEEAGEESLGEEPFGEEAFELPEEFQLPEEGEEALPEEAPPVFEDQGEAAVVGGEEEAEFLRALQEEILPGGPAEPGGPGEAVEWEEAAAPPEGEHVDLEAQDEFPEAASSGEGVPAYEEFSLEGIGEELGAPAEEAPAELPGQAGAPAEEIPAELPPELRMDLGAEAPAPPAGEAAAAGGPPQGPWEAAQELPPGEEAGLSERQFAALRRNLARLPRNLKIAIEELIGERELAGEDLGKLLRLLVGGAAPSAVAEEVSRITGTRIRIPRSFEKLTGLEFEEERRSFAYAFRENILPILRVAALSLAVVGLLGFLGYRYVYRPVQAQVLYRQGYKQIERQRYQLANERFDQALGYWKFKGWFYRYAEGFAGQRQYTLAADKYEELLRRFPGDRRGMLDYAGLLTYHLAGYERADDLTRTLLEQDLKDYDALLARGDNYLEWAAEAGAEEAPGLYEQARFHYASIIDYYGQRDEVLMRMMRYFIRVDKREQTRDLAAYLDQVKLKGVPPELYASVYAELAGYWMSEGEYDGVADMLFTAMEAKPELPEIHYQLARYYLHVRDAAAEARSLEVAIRLLEQTQPLTKGQLYTLIDSYRRLGENHWRRGEQLLAEQSYLQAIARIDEAQGQRIFGREAMFGRVFEDQGDVHYYAGREMGAALGLYGRAVENGHRPAGLEYKIGYIHYSREEFEEALRRFSTVVDQEPRNANALFSLGNALYLGGFHSSAQGYYLRLLDLLEAEEERIPLMLVHENPEHRALAESIMKTYNNLGVTLNRLSARSRDPEKESSALVNLTFSSEYFDVLSRDPESAARGITRNLAYLNQRGILYPETGFEPQIYARIPIDLEAQGL